MNAAASHARELARRHSIDGLLMRYRSVLARAAPRGYNVDRAIQAVIRACRDNPQLAACARDNPASLAAKVHEALTLGLELGPALGEAWIIPYRVKGKLTAQLVIGYRGFVQLAYRAGIKSLVARCVHERDDFRVQFSDEGDKIEHVPCLTGNRGEIVAAYAIAFTNEGGRVCCVLSREDLEKRERNSRAKAEDSPWKMWREEMVIKTAIRYLRRYLPMSPEFMRADQLETLLEIGEPQDEIIQIEEPEDARTGKSTDREDRAQEGASGREGVPTTS